MGEVLCTRLEARGKAEGFSWEHIAQRPDGFFRYREEGADVEPALNFCKLPLKKGDSWKATYKIGGKTATMRYEVDHDSVTVAAGTFNTWLIHGEGGDENHKLKLQSWYAPKVGLVKQTIEDSKKAWNLELELEKFETNDLRK